MLVLDAFFLYSLLLRAFRRGLPLEVPDEVADNYQRFQDPLEDCNQQMAGPGQPEWAHTCDRCAWIYNDEVTGKKRDYIIPLLNTQY